MTNSAIHKTHIKRLGYWSRQITPKDSLPKNMDPKVLKNLDPKLWEPHIENEQYPWPGDLVSPKFWAGRNDKEKIIEYLKSGIPCNHYRGFAGCRLCGSHLSSCERTNGVWCWPDKFEHYIEEHDIILPTLFLGDASLREYKMITMDELSKIVPPYEGGYFHFFVDESFWINWRDKI